MPLNSSYGHEHSEEVQEIIGAVPGWLVRWGISMFFLIIVLILFFAGLIKSPDIVPATLKVDSEDRPQQVLARRDGKLVRLFVREDQLIEKGKLLGFLESHADHEEVLQLSKLVDSLQNAAHNAQAGIIDGLRFNTRTHYGELEPAWQAFYLAYLQYRAFAPRGIMDHKEILIQKEVMALKLLEEQLLLQKQVLGQDLANAEKEYKIHQALARERVISTQELRQQESRYLSQKLPLHNIQAQLIDNSMSQHLKQRELMEIKHEKRQQQAAFLANLQKFKSELESWKKSYVLQAERSGRVVFQQVLKENQWLQANTPVMYVAGTTGEAGSFGELTLGQHAFGKIREGQDVLIRLEAYPSQEFGLLRGKITYLPDVISGDTAYKAMVALPAKTTYGKQVKLQVGLIARAEVVTAEQSLLARIFNSARDLLANR